MFLVPENRWIVFPGDTHGGVVVEGAPFYLRVGSDQNRIQHAVARCRSCGGTSVMSTAVITHNPKTCGCSRRRHGLHRSPVYSVWKSMKDRCLNPACSAYIHYGDRGITICDEWMDLVNFDRWARGSGYLKGLTLDRIDNNGPYSPENCRWVSRTTQMNNTRQNHLVTAFGETKSLAEWGRDSRSQVVPFTIGKRIRAGWSTENAISTPPSAARQKMLETKRKRIEAREARMALARGGKDAQVPQD